MRKHMLLPVLVLALTMPLMACGVKPGQVEPPANAKATDTYPQTYPAANTDPAPTYKKRTAPKAASTEKSGSGLQF